MKKALYIICLFFVSVLFAEEFSYGDFLYKINENDEVILTKCKITNGFVQIPSEINGKKVTTIENDIFKYGNYISSIEIPNILSFFTISGSSSSIKCFFCSSRIISFAFSLTLKPMPRLLMMMFLF